jgi:hypothetical protein
MYEDPAAGAGNPPFEATGRGWLTPKERVVHHAHFKNGEWNAYRVVAKGPRIQVWINGQAVDDLMDEPIHQTQAKGFIGLQVHGIKKGDGPFEVAWRNLRIRELKRAQRGGGGGASGGREAVGGDDLGLAAGGGP